MARTSGRRRTSIAIVIAALAATLLPAAPAHAAYGPDQPVFLSISGGGSLLARVEGTMAFDDQSRMFKYSVRLCWARSYPAPNFWIVINGSVTHTPVWAGPGPGSPECQRVDAYAAEVTHNDIVRNLTFKLNGGWFDNQNQYRRVEREFTYDNPYN